MTKFCLFALAVLLAAAAGPPRLWAQATATATGNALALGIVYQNADPDYGPVRSAGVGVFANYDFSRYLGVTAEVNLPTAFSSVIFLEHSYLVGVRGVYHYGRLQPYGKLLVGESTSTDNSSMHNLLNAPGSYPTYAIGGGVDVRLQRQITIRAIDYESQHWMEYNPHGLTPSLFSFGAAYRF